MTILCVCRKFEQVKESLPAILEHEDTGHRLSPATKSEKIPSSQDGISPATKSEKIPSSQDGLSPATSSKQIHGLQDGRSVSPSIIIHQKYKLFFCCIFIAHL